MIIFKIIYGVDVVVTLIFIYFFFAGIADGTVSGSNITLWLFILAALTGILGGSIWLRSHNHSAVAYIILLVLAIPAVLFGLYMGLAILNKERWN